MIARYMVVILVLLTCGAKFAAAQARAQCSIFSTNIFFGSYTGSVIRVTGILIIDCTPNANYAVGLNAGTSAGATITKRSMTAGSNLLGYGLYSDAAYTENWGDRPGSGSVSGTGDGNIQILRVYAQLPPHQNQPRNTYTDTITATIFGTNFQSSFTRFTVSATVLTACSFSATDLAFGAYSGSLVNATSTIAVTCTNGTDYEVGLNAGTAAGATVTNRRMAGPGPNRLNYQLLSDPARTVNWGNTVGIDTVPGRGSGTQQPLTVYGQLPSNQEVQPGNYSDTITVTVTY